MCWVDTLEIVEPDVLSIDSLEIEDIICGGTLRE